MFWCCCEETESCVITGTPATTLQGVLNVSDESHPLSAGVGWTSLGRLTGTATLSNSSSIIEICYAWKDTANYDYLRCQRGATSSIWSVTLISRRAGVETQLQFKSLGATTIGVSWCVQWSGSNVSLSIGDGAGSVWYGIILFSDAPTLANAGKIGYRVASSGVIAISEWSRHYTEGPLGGLDCAACVGAGVCEGCCGALSLSWSVDLSGFALENLNFTGCIDVDGVYILDSIGTCSFGESRQFGTYEYREPDLGNVFCTSCFLPYIWVTLDIYKDEQNSDLCTAKLQIKITWLTTDAGPCEQCQRHVIAEYRATSATIDDLCNGQVVLTYVGKDPNICGGNPPPTVTISGL